MTTLKQIIRLKAENYTQRSITRHLGIARNTIAKYLGLIQASGLDCKELLALSDADLNELFSPAPQDPVRMDHFDLLVSKFPHYERELKRVGVTKLRASLITRFKNFNFNF